MKPIRVLFVCLGNICRSPLGEGILKDMIHSRGLEGKIVVDSAGTGAYHVGEKPNRQAMAVAHKRGIDISKQRARQLERDDLDRFHHILCMDRQNLTDAKALGRSNSNITLLMNYHPDNADPDVPDPFYGGEEDFHLVYDLVEEACQGFLDSLEREFGA